MRILVRRVGALGDVVLTTPVIRRLRRENPNAEIGVQTAYPDVFRNSPHKLTLIPPGPPPYPWTEDGGLTKLIDLDKVYEMRPTLHIVEAYMLYAFGDCRDLSDMQQEMFYEKTVSLPKNQIVVAVHAAQSGWRNRTLPEETWIELVRMLKVRGHFPILVGSGRDALPKAKCAGFHSHDIMAQASLISQCSCFIGSDSGLLHVAGATEVPIVGIYTCVLPQMRLPIRRGVFGLGCASVQPDIDCLGCLARQPVPATSESCERGDVACVGLVKPDAIATAADILLKQAPRN